MAEIFTNFARTRSSGARRLRNFVRDSRGQGVTEYAIVMSTVVLIALIGVTAISTEAFDILRRVVTALL